MTHPISPPEGRVDTPPCLQGGAGGGSLVYDLFAALGYTMNKSGQLFPNEEIYFLSGTTTVFNSSDYI